MINLNFLDMISSHSRKTRACARRILAAATLFFFLPFQCVWGLPTGAQVESGEVSFESTDTSLKITASNNAIINFNSFDIGLNETVTFIQPDSSSKVLNRVTGGLGASMIQGSLFANGIVFLVNPQGLHFAQSANVNVGGLVASTLNIESRDFLQGNYLFRNDKTSGVIVNEGVLRAAQGGNIALPSNHIENSGLIQAHLGKIVVASADALTLSFDPGNMLMFVIDTPTQRSLQGIDTAVSNSGTIDSRGGNIYIEASAVKDVFKSSVNNSGIIKANSIQEHNGKIEIIATGSTVHSGLIDASSAETGVNAGNISIHSDTIVNQGVLKANAHDDSQAGYIELLGQTKSTYTKDSLIEAKGKDTNSQGGKVYINTLAGDTDYQKGALIDVSGGSISGDAGAIEISAKRQLGYQGSVRGVAQAGYKGGSVFFDPYDIIIQAGGACADTVFGGDIVWGIDEAYDEHLGETLTFDPSANGSFSGFSDIRLQATHDITINSNFNTTTAAGAGNVSLELDADNDININADITTNNASIAFYAKNNITQAATSDISSGSGGIYIYADNDYNGSGVLTRQAGSTITNTGALQFMSASNISTSALLQGTIGTATGDLGIFTNNSYGITIDGNITRVNRNIGFYSAGDLTQNAGTNIIAGSGDVYLRADNNYNGSGTLTRQAGSTISNSGTLMFFASSDMLTSSLLSGTVGATGSLQMQATHDHDIVIDNAISRVDKTVKIYAGGNLTQNAGANISSGIADIELHADDSMTFGTDPGDGNGMGTLTRQAGSTITNSGALVLESASDLVTSSVLQGTVGTATGDLTLQTRGNYSVTVDGAGISRVNHSINIFSGGDLIQNAAANINAGSGNVIFFADNNYDGNGTLTRQAGSTITNSGILYFNSSSDLVTSSLLAGTIGATGALQIFTNGDHSITVDNSIARVDQSITITSSGNLTQNAGTSIDAGSGYISLYADDEDGEHNGIGTLTRQAGSTITNSGDLYLSSASDLTTSSVLTGTAGTATGSLTVYVYDDHSITIDAPLSRVNQGIALYSSGDLTQNAGADISAGSGSVYLYADNSNYYGDLSNVNDIGGITQEALAAVSGGSINFYTAGAANILNVAANGAGSDISITATGPSLTLGELTAADDITVINSGGSVLDDGNVATDLQGDLIKVYAASAIGSSADYLNTRAATLEVSSANGDTYIREFDTATLNLISAHNGSVSISSDTALNVTKLAGASGSGSNSVNLIVRNGDYTVNSVGNARGEEAVGFSAEGGNLIIADNLSANGFNLTATNGNILDGNGAADNITTVGACAFSASGYVGTVADPFEVNINGGSLSITALGQNAGVSIDVNGSIFPSGRYSYNTSISGDALFNSISLKAIDIQSAEVAARQKYIDSITLTNKDKSLKLQEAMPDERVPGNYQLDSIDFSSYIMPNPYNFKVSPYLVLPSDNKINR